MRAIILPSEHFREHTFHCLSRESAAADALSCSLPVPQYVKSEYVILTATLPPDTAPPSAYHLRASSVTSQY